MYNFVYSFLRSLVIAIVNWFDILFNKSEVWPLVFGSFFMFSIYRFILGPLFGGRTLNIGSDRVKRKDDN